MKKIIVVLSLVATLFFLTFELTLAAPPLIYDRVVVGTNTWPTDIENVQAAVNQGGNILLKGTFNFGNWTGLELSPLLKQRLYIRNDIGIYGERDHRGNPLTKIVGGGYTFYSPLPIDYSTTPYSLPDPLPPGPKITVQGLHFDGALLAPIQIAYSRGTVISGNRITHVKPYGPVTLPLTPDSTLASGYYQVGILAGTLYGQAALPPPAVYRAGAFTGEVKIIDNHIDMQGAVPGETVAQGILVTYATGMNAEISGNVVENFARVGIETTDCYADNGAGMVVIEKNRIVSDEIGVPYMNPYAPNGIIIGWILQAAGYDDTKNPLHLVQHNFIQIEGDTAVGLTALADGVLVTNNHIQTRGTEARGLWVYGSHGAFTSNLIQGKGSYAIEVVPTNPAKLAIVLDTGYNFFQGNNLMGFHEQLYDLHFAPGADHNIFLGQTGTVADEGSENLILDFKFMGRSKK